MPINRTVFVVDDDAAVRGAVAALAASHGLPTETFAAAEEFLAAYDPARRGCLIVNVEMPGLTGLDLLERLTAGGATQPVIIVADRADVATAVRAMHGGAFTVLEKPCADDELWSNVTAALAEEDRIHRERQCRAEIIARRDSLTPAEHQVLAGLIVGKANKLIAMDLGVGLRTAELRRATIMKKMQAGSLAELVRMILFADGKLDEPPPPSDPEAL